ncbi:MAG: aminotransferase class I/II-fold pyridoxal phosphate-dependent enzyme [Bdellovibrionales bacterium]|nr:aminotransferase class I/II-fold pyridoxal phosphate-dependent enzyme [Bdellovibrionales bacterium]
MSVRKRDIFTKCREFQYAQQAKASGCYPYFRPIEGLQGNKVVYDGRPMIMIGSNNYLGLAHDPRVIEASQQAISQFGVGCTGSRFLNGNSVIHEKLEDELAALLQKEAVLLHSTGFFANLGTLNTLCTEGDWILCDRENHASIIEGCQSSSAKTLPFAHNCIKTLRRRLQRVPEGDAKMIIMDGVYSMSGDIARLPEIVGVAKEMGAQTYVDEAHALGVLGPRGEGTVAHFGLQKDVDLIMGTFSKSLGSMGGFIAGPKDVIDFLRHTTRCMIFTASLAPAIVGAVRKSLELMLNEPERREQLWKNTRKMHAGFKSLGFNIGTTQTPVVPILIGSETKAFLFAHKLLEAGIFVTPAVYPAVKFGQAIVRTSYTATHTEDELDYVLETFARLGKELGIFEDAAYIGTTNSRGKPYSGYDFSLYQQESAKTVRAGS